MSQPLIKALSGTERDQALDRLDAAIVKVLQSQAPESFVAEVAACDPSLLLERSRFTGLGFNALNYLELARMMQWVATVEVALAAGIHPDDPTAFGGRPMLSMRGDNPAGTLPGPELLALGLRYGADASQRASDGPHALIKSLAHTYLTEIDLLSSSHLAVLERQLKCMRLLLEAQPGDLDVAGYLTASGPNPDATRWGSSFLLRLGSCAILGSNQPESLPLMEEVYALMRLAAARGADINWRYAGDGVPAVWRLTDYGRIDAAIVLIELGADTEWPSDTSFTLTLSDSTVGKAPSLVEHAALRDGRPAAARLQAALMRQAIDREMAGVTPMPAAAETMAQRRRKLL